jgi:AcrR family transcriptional regulator
MSRAEPIRSRNAGATRRSILEAACERFLRDGYDQASVRAIAADAGIDAALIFRYFGSKEGLFAEVLETTAEDPTEVLSGDRATFGERVARAVLDPAEHSPSRIAFLHLAASSSVSDVASGLVRRHIEKQFIVPFTRWLAQDDAAEKAWLAASVLIGVSVMTNLEQSREPAKTGSEIDRLARLLQSIVDA